MTGVAAVVKTSIVDTPQHRAAQAASAMRCEDNEPNTMLVGIAPYGRTSRRRRLSRTHERWAHLGLQRQREALQVGFIRGGIEAVGNPQ